MNKAVCIFLLVCSAIALAQQRITRDFFAMDMNKASQLRGQRSPWPDDCCRGEATPVRFGVWRSLGAQVNWDQIAEDCTPRNGADPNDHCYAWDRLDGYLRQVAAHGEEALYVVFDTPAFANNGAGANFPPSDVGADDRYLKDFVTAVYKHATAKGWHIKYWECWNEPDIRNEYSGNLQQLLNICRDIHQTIHALDPTAQVLSPAFTSLDIIGHQNRDEIDPTSCSGRDCSLMQQYLAAGGGQHADIIAYHGYAFPDPVDPLFDSRLSKDMLRYNVVNLTSKINAIVQHTGNRGKPVWMTEGGDDLPPTSQDALANDDRHAAFVGRYLLEYMGRGSSLVSWYGWDFSGPIALLAGHKGDPDDRLNKGGQAYRQIYNWTVDKGATMTAPCTPNGTIYTCTFSDHSGRTMLAMYDTSQDCNPGCSTMSKTVPADFTKWTDLEGGIHQIVDHKVPVGRKPILLETSFPQARKK